jgi:hypothetical protein
VVAVAEGAGVLTAVADGTAEDTAVVTEDTTLPAEDTVLPAEDTVPPAEDAASPAVCATLTGAEDAP